MGIKMNMIREKIERDVEEYAKRGLLEKKTLGEALQEWSRRYGDKTALVDEKRRLSYRQLWEEANSRAVLFYQNGIRKGDNIIVQMPNSVDYIGVCFALFLIGARPVLMLPSHSDTELEAVSKIAEPVAVVTVEKDLGVDYGSMARSLKKMISSVRAIFLDGPSEDGINMEEAQAITEVFAAEDIPAPCDIALFLLSGGTTGVPKLIPRIHAAYLCNAKESARRCDTNGDSVYLAALSTAHDYPLCCPGIMGTLLNGGKCVLCKTPGADEAFEWIEAEKVTFTQLVPVVASMWLEALEWESGMDLSSLRYIQIGAAKLERELAMGLEKAFGCKIIQGYGLGEGITCFTSPQDLPQVAWETQGKPVSWGDCIRIVNEKGEEAACGEVGELWEKGPYTFYGYYRAPERNKDLFSEDGFLKTGDKARLTKEGNLVIMGRVREQINRAGENIVPEEIESFIRQSDAVRDVAVIGLPDSELGERVCAVLVKNDRELTFGELRDFLASLKIAKYKFPDQIVYIDEMPYINVGKADKKRLKKMLAAGEE